MRLNDGSLLVIEALGYLHYDDYLSSRQVVLYGVLNHIEHYELVFLPVSVQSPTLQQILHREIHRELVRQDLRYERKRDLENVVVGLSRSKRRYFELVLADLHSLDLIEVIVVHYFS